MGQARDLTIVVLHFEKSLESLRIDILGHCGERNIGPGRHPRRKIGPDFDEQTKLFVMESR